MQFFKVTHNSTYNDQFARAYKIMPKSEVEISICPECNAVQKIPKGAFNVAVEGGNQYPDILGCGAYPFFIISAKVVTDWEKNGVCNFAQYPVNIARDESNVSTVDKPPSYFRIEPEGHCKIDLEASGLQVIRHCPKCNYLKTQPTVPQGYQIAANSWDGSEIFRDPNLYPRVIFCTHKIMNLANQFQHTNFRFEHMEGPFDLRSSGIDYLTNPLL